MTKIYIQELYEQDIPDLLAESCETGVQFHQVDDNNREIIITLNMHEAIALWRDLASAIYQANREITENLRRTKNYIDGAGL